MGNKTYLYNNHLQLNAKIVDFGGWDMPLHYSSQVTEHNQVRNSAGMFDVSHMTVIDLAGEKVRDLLAYLLANDVGRLKNVGKALYSCMLNENGGVIDDLIVYFLSDTQFRLVVNAGTTEKDVAWIRKHAKDFQVDVKQRDDLAIIAVQGPLAREKVKSLLPADLQESAIELKPFNAAWNDEIFVGRTGYTGEDGFEVILPGQQASDFWNALLAADVAPIGLGARDTLRLEAGMNLYGVDMDENCSPLEAGLTWTVAFKPEDRDFIGRKALEAQREQANHDIMIALVLEQKGGVLRGHQTVTVDGGGVGQITSGSFSPTIGKSIAFARVPAGNYDEVMVTIRNKQLAAKVVKPPFVRNGKVLV
jgi:aminomethyltransferase